MASYDLLLIMLKLKPRPEEQIPCHSSFSNGIICGPNRGSFAVQVGDHFRSGDHLRRCTILTTTTKSNYSRKCYTELLKQLKKTLKDLKRYLIIKPKIKYAKLNDY